MTSIDQDKGNLIHAAGKRFPHTHRERANAPGFIIIVLVNVLADIDTGNTQTIGNTRQDHIPDIAEIPAFDQRHDVGRRLRS